MFGCQLKVKEKVLLGFFVLFLLIMSFAAGNYYRSLSIFIGVFLFGIVMAVMALRLECQERNEKE